MICLEHAASVAKTFLMSECVVVEIKEPKPVSAGNSMDNSGYSYYSESIDGSLDNNIRTHDMDTKIDQPDLLLKMRDK
ncbi:hypothetical protein HID58_032979 [Brassica napus]|uniref:Uncharacterized protein n=2 Tax=Brassica TaxID=3705 RepID=A0ABQ8BXZ8_BRANA|nr:hypothetical protein HID58_032979 [Brassica napus]